MNKNILPPTWLRFALIVLLVMGIFFRFTNIGLTVYSIEETATSLRLSGYLEEEVKAEAFQGEVVSSADLHKYQTINSQKSLNDTIKGLILEEPQLSPLYYILARFWTQWFGDSATVIRSLSAVISLLAFPALYWLCWELFRLPLVGYMAMMLMAVSPFFVLYAQEARLYSLWIVTALFISAIFLRAIRINNKIWWAIYSIALSLGFYTTPLSLLIAMGHSVYIIGTQGIRLSKIVIAYVLSSLAAVILFSPWLYFIIYNFSTSHNTTEWTSIRKIPLFSLFGSFIVNIIYTFLDIPSSTLWKYLTTVYSWADIIIGVIGISISILVGYAFFFLLRQTPKNIWLFSWSLFGITSLIFLVPDLLFGGIRSVIPRFQVPLYISILITVAYLVSYKSIYVTQDSRKQTLWRLITIGLISCGIISCTFISRSNIWWNKYFNTDNLPMAKIINQTPSPLVISDSGASHYLNILSLNHLLEPKVKFLLFYITENNIDISSLSDEFSDLFLLNPSSELKEVIKENQIYNLDAVYDGSKENPWRSDLSLWKLTKKESKL